MPPDQQGIMVMQQRYPAWSKGIWTRKTNDAADCFPTSGFAYEKHVENDLTHANDICRDLEDTICQQTSMIKTIDWWWTIAKSITGGILNGNAS